MSTLFQATLELARELGAVFEGEADSGSSTTKLVDAALKAAEQTYKGGTLWITSGTYANTTRIIDKQPANELHWTDALAGAISAGDDYAVAIPEIARDALRRAVNKALQDAGFYTKYDTSLTTVADQVEYSLATGVRDLDNVQIATATAEPKNPYFHLHYEETHDGKLRFNKNVPALSGYEIRIGYPQRHDWLYADADAILAGINLERLKWEAALIAYRELLQGHNSRALDELTEDWFDEAGRRAAISPAHRLTRLIRRGMA